MYQLVSIIYIRYTIPRFSYFLVVWLVTIKAEFYDHTLAKPQNRGTLYVLWLFLFQTAAKIPLALLKTIHLGKLHFLTTSLVGDSAEKQAISGANSLNWCVLRNSVIWVLGFEVGKYLKHSSKVWARKIRTTSEIGCLTKFPIAPYHHNTWSKWKTHD